MFFTLYSVTVVINTLAGNSVSPQALATNRCVGSLIMQQPRVLDDKQNKTSLLVRHFDFWFMFFTLRNKKVIWV
jgi:hypothetical protein